MPMLNTIQSATSSILFGTLVAMTAVPAADADGPAIWRVSDEDTQIYLMGTYHLIAPETRWQTGTFETLMQDAPVTMIETDATSAEAQARLGALIREHGLNPPGVTLDDTLGEARAEVFAGLAERYGLSVDRLQPMRPWLAMLSLTQAVYAAEGYSGDSGPEQAILALAAAQEDTVGYLEDISVQVEALAGLDEAELLASFDVGVETLDSFADHTAASIEAWRTGDTQRLDTLLLQPMRDTAPAAYQAVFLDRNANWAETLGVRLDDDGGVYFVAVGAGHLIGDGSVVDRLSGAGYTVERVQ